MSKKTFFPVAHAMDGWIAYKDILVASGVLSLVETTPDERNWLKHSILPCHAYTRVMNRLHEQALKVAISHERDDLVKLLVDRRPAQAHQ